MAAVALGVPDSFPFVLLHTTALDIFPRSFLSGVLDSG